ncbi:hypothetical protein M501DRAFT_1016934 [Patellaria atrata CBS 101060]|uniref:Uncharacterized protein n=1 Tax=Patellaria atrata CBS 101060 TaxID=1346257 RepID=A0A9P4SA15_9PEZI|nr:hypothetical protein M501DRAFT_1016934 [Patellaria atrata CBS 101060]
MPSTEQKHPGNWLLRGAQSALFYYVACTPWAEYAGKRRRRRQAKKSREQNGQLQMEQPDLYHQPAPFATNPYWQAEIDAGPGPAPRKSKRSRTNSSRGLTSAGTQGSLESANGSSVNMHFNHNSPSSYSRIGLDGTGVTANSGRIDHQRSEGSSWRIGGNTTRTARSFTASSAGSFVMVPGVSRPPTARTTTRRSISFTNAPVNDLHPPVVSMPLGVEDTRWMIQRPPPPKFMSSKADGAYSNRSRSGSGASSRTHFEPTLRQRVSEKLLEESLRRTQTDESTMVGSEDTLDKQYRKRDMESSSPITSEPHLGEKRSSKSMARTTSERSGDSTESVFYTPGPGYEHQLQVLEGTDAADHAVIPELHRRRSRKVLSTILSSESIPVPVKDSTPFDENFHRTDMRRKEDTNSHQLMVRDSSLNILQDLVDPRALLKSRFVSAPAIEARIKLPPNNSNEDLELYSESEDFWVPRDASLRWSSHF